MVNFLEGLYAVAALLVVAFAVLFLKRRRAAAMWCLFAAFVTAICAALLYVRLSPTKIARALPYSITFPEPHRA